MGKTAVSVKLPVDLRSAKSLLGLGAVGQGVQLHSECRVLCLPC